jgi:hypothetical protein
LQNISPATDLSVGFTVLAFECHSIILYRLLLKIVKIRRSIAIILTVVLYGCETGSVISKEEHRLRLFENRVLRGMFGLRREEVRG